MSLFTKAIRVRGRAALGEVTLEGEIRAAGCEMMENGRQKGPGRGARVWACFWSACSVVTGYKGSVSPLLIYLVLLKYTILGIKLTDDGMFLVIEQENCFCKRKSLRWIDPGRIAESQ